MDALAQNLLPGLVYVGVVYDGSVAEYVRDVPGGGRDVLAAKVFWRFPAGALRCLSVRDLRRARLAELDEAETREAYERVANAYGYTFLGVATDSAALDDLKTDAGTYQDRRWEKMQWRLPAGAMDVCWWVAGIAPYTKEPTALLAKSLAVLRAELHRLRVATMSTVT
eukprot:834639-Lingulodinium_polyedra.AAC.1